MLTSKREDDPYIEQKQESWRIFNSIARRYDLLNRLLSLGIDMHWRRVTVGRMKKRGGRVIDLATGTADMLIMAGRKCDEIREAYGIDLSKEMLAVAMKKIEHAGEAGRLRLVRGDVNALPFPDDHFDIASMAFGIRNVPDPRRALDEMRRILAPDGQACILEFSRPRSKMLSCLYLFYLQNIVPFVGWLLTGKYGAYRYLNRTIEAFPCGRDFVHQMESCGFRDARELPLTFGIATLYLGRK